ncbi:hypothetical protein CDIK_1345 [Cucumispora dikerogammari]|nr:hypothetical protein CDIK_1345 [Cucumispora dikerogammari]
MQHYISSILFNLFSYVINNSTKNITALTVSVSQPIIRNEDAEETVNTFSGEITKNKQQWIEFLISYQNEDSIETLKTLPRLTLISVICRCCPLVKVNKKIYHRKRTEFHVIEVDSTMYVEDFQYLETNKNKYGETQKHSFYIKPIKEETENPIIKYLLEHDVAIKFSFNFEVNYNNSKKTKIVSHTAPVRIVWSEKPFFQDVYAENISENKDIFSTEKSDVCASNISENSDIFSTETSDVCASNISENSDIFSTETSDVCVRDILERTEGKKHSLYAEDKSDSIFSESDDVFQKISTSEDVESKPVYKNLKYLVFCSFLIILVSIVLILKKKKKRNDVSD